MKDCCDRWCIHIDIEGFSALYGKNDAALLSLGALMEGIYHIGNKCYPEYQDRIWAYQTGDGFFVVGDHWRESLEIPVSIAIALMRHVTKCGCFAKSSIAEGGNADIVSCYPQCVQDALVESKRVRIGRGIMTLFPVMGTALINAVGIDKRSPKGALLTLDSSNAQRVPENCIVKEAESNDIISVDWVNSELSLVAEIQGKASLFSPDSEALKNSFKEYYSESNAPDNWKANTNSLLSLGLQL